MIPAMIGKSAPASLSALSTNFTNSSRSRVCPSPVLPPTARPWQPASLSHLNCSAQASKSILPEASNAVVDGAMIPSNFFMVVSI